MPAPTSFQRAPALDRGPAPARCGQLPLAALQARRTVNGFRRSVALACLAIAIAVLVACQQRQAGAPAAPVSPAPRETSNSSPVRRPPPPPSVSQALDEELHSHGSPKTVADMQPVDTRILDVAMSNESDGKRLTGPKINQFQPTDGVFVAIRTQGTAARYALTARWLSPEGQTLTEYGQAIATAGPVDTVFSLSKPDGWAPGRYSVQLSINGRPQKTVAFTVR